MYNPLEQVFRQAGINPALAKQSSFYRPPPPVNLQQPTIQQPPVQRGEPNVQEGQQNQAPVGSRSSFNMSMASDPFIQKLIKVESGGNPNAISPTGATGLTQFLPSTAKPILKSMGKTWEDYKRDPNLQLQVTNRYLNTIDNTIKQAGLPINNVNRWIGWNAGPGSLRSYAKGGQISPNIVKLNSNIHSKFEKPIIQLN